MRNGTTTVAYRGFLNSSFDTDTNDQNKVELWILVGVIRGYFV